MFPTQVLRRPRKLFYGWVIVGVSFVAQAIQNGTAVLGLGAFMVPLEQEFGWNKTTLAGARSVATVETGVLGPLNGIIVDKFGPRFSMTAGIALFGLGFVFLGLAQNPLTYYLATGTIALGGSLMGYLTISVTLNNWFRAKRTMALAIAQTGTGVGGILIVPALTWAISAYDWRFAAIFTGIGVWLIGIPVSLLIRHSPEQYGTFPDGIEPQRQVDAGVGGKRKLPKGEGAPDFTLKEALRTRAFWLLATGHGLGAMILLAINVHQFAHMEQGVGLSRSSAAFVVTVTSAMAIAGWLFTGLVGDRLNKRLLATAGAVGIGAGLIVLATSHSMAQSMLFAVLTGLSWGTRFPVITSIRGDYFGRGSFGKISGTAGVFVMLFSLSGPLVAGAMADLLGDYQLAFIILGILGGAVGALSFALLRPPAPPRRAAALG